MRILEQALERGDPLVVLKDSPGRASQLSRFRTKHNLTLKDVPSFSYYEGTRVVLFLDELIKGEIR